MHHDTTRIKACKPLLYPNFNISTRLVYCAITFLVYKLFITFGDLYVGIKHYLVRVNRSQTNGKVEIFFLTYKTEYTTGTFKCLKDHIKQYNENRLHMSLNYQTPKEVWEELTNCKVVLE